MLPKLHPLEKTAIEVRRAIHRLEHHQETNPNDPHVISGVVELVIRDLKAIRSYIPKELLDTDIQGAP